MPLRARRLLALLCVIALLCALPLAGLRTHDIWFGDGVRASAPTSLLVPGTTRVQLRQPVARMIATEVGFVVPRAEWRGPAVPSGGPRGPSHASLDGVALGYRFAVRDAQGRRITAFAPDQTGTGTFNVRFTDWLAPAPRGDVEVFLFLPGFTVGARADYEVAFEVVTPIRWPHADRATIAFIPIARDGLQQAAGNIELALWAGLILGLGAALVALGRRPVSLPAR